MACEIIRLADHRTLRTRAYAPPIRHFTPAPDAAVLVISCLLWWSAVLVVTASEIARKP